MPERKSIRIEGDRAGDALAVRRATVEVQRENPNAFDFQWDGYTAGSGGRSGYHRVSCLAS
ncbi:hypothetical protein ABZV91_18865 [Nocardia sp. NPDC004568]|uniref:hypothetical protein n=1 Tax=Nocardia sp. NPDC004568 TaxID=3154551 RepID=UPI0033B1DDA8